MKRGYGARPLTEFEINAVQRVSKSALECARRLHVDYKTYKKYATLYGVFDKVKNKAAKGIPRDFDPHKGLCSIDSILRGEHPNYPTKKIKAKIIKAGIKEEKCELCGYDEKRITDGKAPIWIHFKDDNKKNHLLENIQFLCLNCFHNTVGRLWGNEKRLI